MSIVSPGVRAHSVAYAGLAILFVISCAQWVRNTSTSVDYILHSEQLIRNPFEIDPVTSKAADLEPEAEAAGLRSGDTVVAIEGHPLAGLSDFEGATRRARLGDRLRVRIRPSTATGSVEKDVSIVLAPFTYLGLTKASSPAFGWIILPSILLPLFCLLLGFWVAAVRVGDSAAWLLVVLMLGFANTITEDRVLFGNEDALQPFLTAFVAGFNTLAPPALVFFGIVFPERLAPDRRFPWIKWMVFGPLLIEAALSTVYYALLLHHLDLARTVWLYHRPFEKMGQVLRPAAYISFFAILIFKTVRAQSRDARRRLVLLDAGAAIGIAPLAILYVVEVMTGIDYKGWPVVGVITALLIFPLTMAYVIVVHRAMEVRVVVRQGLQYLLATGGIRVLQVVISIAIIVVAANIGTNTSVASRVVAISVGFALLAGLSAFAQRLRGWIDRRFFREACEADAVLADLAAKVRTMVETGPLLEMVASRVASALHVPRIAILLDRGNAFLPAYALGYAAPPAASLSSQSLTARRLSKAQHALVEFDRADSWVQLADDEERAALEELKPELLLPLSLNEKVLGIMSLGPKRSEEPFSKTDIRLLDSVAAQTGLALENGRLTEAIHAEAAAREKRHRELELAREVQERLFPQEYPRLPGLDYAGACRPALGVGGDYYDFIPVADGGMVIAIGDVSGKGISAALLMATLRAFLRGQTIDRETDLTVVIANLNRLVYESSAHNRYATFFFAVLDSSSRVLNYVNAGHNAPILIRGAAGSEVLRLEDGGSVVGLMQSGEWSQGQARLEPGDLLVAYTDGVSEAMNAEDEEWGEDRMIDTIRAKQSAPAQAILERIMAAADEFAAGVPQYDDMTLIVMRVV